jgi:hypothetical protein
MEMKVSGLRRYPVKSMAGEAIGSVRVNSRGVEGDRLLAVVDGDGRLASAKNTKRLVRRDRVFEYAASMVLPGADAEAEPSVLVEHAGLRWRAGSPELDAHLCAVMGADVRVTEESDVPFFDDGAVSLVGTATLDWCARELGADADPRRLRVNVVVETTEPFAEEAWTGDLRIGDVVLRPAGRVERCRTIDLPQDGVAERTRWLKPLGDNRDARVAIYLDVVTAGTVSVGDAVIPPQ